MRTSRSLAILSAVLIAVLAGCHPFEDLSEDPFLDAFEDGFVADSKGDGEVDASSPDAGKPDVEPPDLIIEDGLDGQLEDGQQGEGVTVDAESDSSWTPGAESVAANCDSFCRKLAVCGQLDTADFGACTQTCAEGLSTMNADWFRKVACVVEAECGGLSNCEKPVEPLAGCLGICDAIEVCEAYSMFEMFDNPQACIWSCEGAGMAGTNFAGVIDCLTDALTASCSAAGPILACLNPFDCVGLCSTNMVGCPPRYSPLPAVPEPRGVQELLRRSRVRAQARLRGVLADPDLRRGGLR
ncbi:MAG: hypothetical protein AUK47_28995 [Deltaproteobacteria bacterium CG2_30_63_29]|nr:MAG: hypothetical protein AUK47_28995 [Deltaproteobacteria bacterium CG2_30_63_29]PIW00431.1 MAG: hypothetical protein COW42_07805 [Deltaproteobacteria bacterium CG17_big_fil_post_rev_8_21_14_2_50_63_7]